MLGKKWFNCSCFIRFSWRNMGLWHFTLISFLCVEAFSTDITDCPHHLSRSDLYAYGDWCLKVHYGNWDWETARQICLNEGGDLVQPRTPGMQEYIHLSLLPQMQKSEDDGFWIGATDMYSEFHWRWVSGDPSMPYSNWEPGQGPSQSGFLFAAGDLEDCALMWIQSGFRWHDYPCSNFFYHYSFICQHRKLPRSTHHAQPSHPTKLTTKYVPITTTKYVQPTTTKYIPPTTTKYVPPTTTRLKPETYTTTRFVPWTEKTTMLSEKTRATTAFFTSFSTGTTDCPHHLSKSDLYAYGDWCLKVHYGNWDWDTSRQICLNEGGDLVQPRSPDMQEYIRNILRPQMQKSEDDGFWIGATDLYSESHWRWVSGDPSMPYSNWESGQGISQSGFLFAAGDLEDCAVMWIQDGFRWNDKPCSNFFYHYSFICQYKKLPRSTHRVHPTKLMTTRYVPPTTTKIIPTTTTKYIPPRSTKYVPQTTTRFEPETYSTTRFVPWTEKTTILSEKTRSTADKTHLPNQYQTTTEETVGLIIG